MRGINGEIEASMAVERRSPMLPPPPPPPVPGTAAVSQVWKQSRLNDDFCCSSMSVNNIGDRLFDEAYRADVLIHTSHNGIIYAHANILGVASPVMKEILKQSKRQGRRRQQSISIIGVPPEAVKAFIRFLYSSCYEQDEIEEHVLHFLVLSHTYVIRSLKQLCECWIQHKLLTTETAIDIFQLAMLCDVPRLSLFCHRFILKNMKSVSITEGWKAMKQSHPFLEEDILASILYEDTKMKERTRKAQEKQIYQQLYEAMEAVVHIFKDGCLTIGPHDKVPRKDQLACPYEACKGVELLVRHFAVCKRRVSGGCIHCKRMWQVLELHSRMCANSQLCKVPLCSKFRQRRKKQNKVEAKWRILVRKIVRSKSIIGAPFFTLTES